jgi:FkbH-like protein
MTSISTLLRTAKSLVAAGRKSEAVEQLQRELRKPGLAAADVESIGLLLTKIFKDAEFDARAVSVRFVAQCTSTWLLPYVTAQAWRRGVILRTSEAQYDNVLQDLLAIAASPSLPQLVVLLPWTQRLFESATAATPPERVADESQFWQQAWQVLVRSGVKIVQLGYDSPNFGPRGALLTVEPQGNVGLVREVNRELRRGLPPGACFVDLELIAGEHGRRKFYDPRSYFWTKQPFSESGLLALSRHLAAAIRAQTIGPSKVLVLDLDNTLWGGVVGETGSLGIELGETPHGQAFIAFQKYVKGLSQRGCLLAVSSKNNVEDAREPFKNNPEMVLQLGDLAAFEASWAPKSQSLRRIAETLNLGLDSLVFFDDNPAEREEIRQALPEVLVVDVPEDPAEFIPALEAELCFEATTVTSEDLQRNELYQAEQQRKNLQSDFATFEAYLQSLKMIGTAAEIDERSLGRVVQLIGKTNQFNVTTRRHGQDFVAAILREPRSIGLAFNLSDRFGDYGLIGVVLATEAPGAAGDLVIDTMLMSCRVIARTMEEFMLRETARWAVRLGYTRMLGQYIPTAKNQFVADLFPKLGFTTYSAKSADDSSWYAFDLRESALPVTYVSGSPDQAAASLVSDA